ncbi:hypothetical protein Fbal_3241 [Ferrimonas balearica DSM 9799]|uniref:Uncharacterized protein n=2 Tax=Ferrimonas balearica TaxID=44012 RepID=E1SVY9_FERBD|nr:hypothetical protein Fbal_3241 [Ferrimonas balearica DSM 9799]
MTALTSYWPDNKRVDTCIMTEAESLSGSLLMAVHEPMRLIKRQHTTGKEARTDEQALFEFLMAHNRPIPITGAAGVGKSHIIRWLGAKLKRLHNADKFKTIYIPKSSSIARVLELITEGLEGEVYDEIRRSIDGISQTIDVQHIAEHLALKLRLALGEEFEQVCADIESGREVKPEDVHRFECVYQHAQGLQALLQDSHLTKHFTRPGACLYNIAERLYLGVKDDQGFEQDYQMFAHDFEIQMEVAAAAHDAQTYIQNEQLLTEPDAREKAAWTINQVLYKACGKTIEELLRISPTSVQQVVRSIRQQLLADDKDNTLVILIEDFTTTSAIQKEFIECLLEEEEYHGEQRLCPLKSVIAVTEGFAGYLHVRDGILGRTGYEWLIESASQNESETLERIFDFCGRYLNAARHGAQQLESNFGGAGMEHSGLAIWHDGEVQESEFRSRLDAFGYSRQRYPLFPFNRLALEQLARQHCVAHGQLIFHPRSILHYLLRTPLKEGYGAYLDGQFPPEKWDGPICNPAIASQLNVLSEQGRAKKLAAVWGGNPSSMAALTEALSLGVCEEFGLAEMCQVLGDAPQPTVTTGGKGQAEIKEQPNPETKEKVKTEIETVTNEEQAPEVPVELISWRSKLDNWYQGTAGLQQQDAAQLRKWICDGLNAVIDWGHHLCRPKPLGSSKLPAGRIHLPVKTGNTGAPVLDLTVSGAFAKYGEQWVNAFYAMATYHHYGKSWDFPGGANDYLYYHNFFDSVSPQVVDHLIALEREELGAVASKLLQGAGFLGAEGANSSIRLKRLNALLFEAQEKPEHELLGELDSRWEQVIERRKSLRGELLRLTAAKKTGAEPYAIDGTLVAEALKQPAAAEPDVMDKVLKELPAIRNELQPVASELHDLFAGDRTAIAEASAQIKDVLALAVKADVVRPFDMTKTLKSTLRRWESDERVEVVKQLSRLQLPEDNPVRLMQELVTVDAAQFEVIREFLLQFSNFESATSLHLKNKIKQQGGGEIEQAQQDVFAQLDEIGSQLQQLEELN